MKDNYGPIVVGGIGGSGTRVVAKILQELGFYMGNDLNEPIDNLSYTLLFKRKDWFYKNGSNQSKIFKGLRILEKTMTNEKPAFTISEYCFLLNATYFMYQYGHNHLGDGKGKWAIDRFNNILKGSELLSHDYIGWGWKEPNSHLILPHLAEYFPNLKYIHTIRNGLDMAYSSNQQQLYNWGPMFGIELPDKEEDIPETSFRYWLKANKKVMSIGNKIGDNKFYVLNFDKIFLDKENELANLLSFVGCDISSEVINKIKTLINKPITIQRYRKYENSWLSEKYLDELNYLGF